MTSYIYNMVDTWNNGATTFTAVKMDVTDSASNAASLLMDLQVGTASKLKVGKNGGLALGGGSLNTNEFNTTTSGGIRFGSGIHGLFPLGSTQLHVIADGTTTIISSAATTRINAGNFVLGAADAATAQAKTLSVQSVVTGTSNTAGANFTINGSQGTGNAAGGSIIFQVAPAGGSGNTPNALATALTIASTGAATFSSTVTSGGNIIIPVAASIGNSSGNQLAIGAGNIYPAINALSLGTFTVPFSLLALGTGSNAALLTADAANTLALRNGNNGQTFRLYGRFTDITNDFERFFIEAPTTSGAAVLLGTQKGATTGAARALAFQTDGTTRLTIPSNGGVWTTSGEFFHFRASANTSASVLSPADGVMTLGNWNADNFNRLQFGGTSASFPALKRSTTSLQAVLANDTGFTNIQGKLTTDTAYTAGDPATTGYLVVYDSTGTAYKIPALAV